MNVDIETIFYNIITHELGGTEASPGVQGLLNENVWIANENKKIPIDENLYITVGMVDAQVVSHNTSYEPTTSGMTQTQQLVQRENVQIDIVSASSKARLIRARVLMAFRSLYAVQQMEENDCKIFRIPTSFVNTSLAEGAEQVNRFTLTIPTLVWYNNSEVLETSDEYFDSFDTRVDDENTIGAVTGLMEFNIPDLIWVDSLEWDDAEAWIE